MGFKTDEKAHDAGSAGNPLPHLANCPNTKMSSLLKAKYCAGNEDQIDKENGSPSHAASKISQYNHPEN